MSQQTFFSCVVYTHPNAPGLARADLWQASDFSSLIYILFSLAEMHKHLGRASGNIDSSSLCRDADGRLVLALDLSQPSKCQQVKQGANSSRFFINVGQSPQEIDDLAALGVALAQLLIKPNNLPAFTGNSVQYRESLIRLLRPKKLETIDRQASSVASKLLHVERHPVSSSKFLKSQLGLLCFTNAGDGRPKLKSANWLDLIRHSY